MGLMPYGRCPECGALYHLNVSMPMDEWWDKYFPGADRTLPFPALCFNCWKKEEHPGEPINIWPRKQENISD